jgi:hypothetical protein
VELTLLTLICFAALAAIVAAVGLILRDLASASTANVSPLASQMSAPLTLRRLTLARDQTTPQGITESIDHHFGRMVIESGWDCTPVAASLVLVCCGLITGGVLFLASDNLLLAALGMLFGFFVALAATMVVRARRMKAMG